MHECLALSDKKEQKMLVYREAAEIIAIIIPSIGYISTGIIPGIWAYHRIDDPEHSNMLLYIFIMLCTLSLIVGTTVTVTLSDPYPAVPFSLYIILLIWMTQVALSLISAAIGYLLLCADSMECTIARE